MPNLALALHVASEYSNEKSFWKPYLNIIPSSYNTPLYMTPNELEYLLGSPVFEECVKLLRSIARQYAYFWTQMHSKNSIANQLYLKKNFTFTLYRLVVGCLSNEYRLTGYHLENVSCLNLAEGIEWISWLESDQTLDLFLSLWLKQTFIAKAIVKTIITRPPDRAIIIT